jgi:hypothetical protein
LPPSWLVLTFQRQPRSGDKKGNPAPSVWGTKNGKESNLLRQHGEKQNQISVLHQRLDEVDILIQVRQLTAPLRSKDGRSSQNGPLTRIQWRGGGGSPSTAATSPKPRPDGRGCSFVHLHESAAVWGLAFSLPPGFARRLEFLHFAQFCRVAYKKKGNPTKLLGSGTGKTLLSCSGSIICRGLAGVKLCADRCQISTDFRSITGFSRVI